MTTRPPQSQVALNTEVRVPFDVSQIGAETVSGNDIYQDTPAAGVIFSKIISGATLLRKVTLNLNDKGSAGTTEIEVEVNGSAVDIVSVAFNAISNTASTNLNDYALADGDVVTMTVVTAATNSVGLTARLDIAQSASLTTGELKRIVPDRAIVARSVFVFLKDSGSSGTTTVLVKKFGVVIGTVNIVADSNNAADATAFLGETAIGPGEALIATCSASAVGASGLYVRLDCFQNF